MNEQEAKMESAKLAQGYNLWVNMLTTIVSSPMSVELYKKNPGSFMENAKSLAYEMAGAIAEEGANVESKMAALKVDPPSGPSNMKLVTP